MDLSKIRSEFTHKTPKRLGRGSGSGWGKTAGRGNKGAGSRSGKKVPYVGFAGGNIPYIRKLPKRGFNAFRPKEYQIVNLGDIQSRVKDTKEIDPKTLYALNLIKDSDKPVKILAALKEKLSLKITFKADSFSQKAKKLIEEAGGKAECLTR
jgi:large subunit ribosomal protein L15